jgi:hypothetical protein
MKTSIPEVVVRFPLSFFYGLGVAADALLGDLDDAVMGDGLADHCAKILGVEVAQVNQHKGLERSFG